MTKGRENWRSLRARMREAARQNLETLRSRLLKPELLATFSEEERWLLRIRQQTFARRQAVRDERARRAQAVEECLTMKQRETRNQIGAINRANREFNDTIEPHVQRLTEQRPSRLLEANGVALLRQSAADHITLTKAEQSSRAKLPRKKRPPSLWMRALRAVLKEEPEITSDMLMGWLESETRTYDDYDIELSSKDDVLLIKDLANDKSTTIKRASLRQYLGRARRNAVR